MEEHNGFKKTTLDLPIYSFSGSGDNITLDDPLNNNLTGPWYWPWCASWKPSQHIMFQISYVLFLASYSAPCTKKGQLFMHSTLIFAYLLYSIWAWQVICAPDVFTWNFSFFLVNIAHVVYIIYQMRPVKFDPELEEAYHNLFEPFKVSRIQFKRMVSSEFAQIMSLHAGEAYAMQNLTKTDRLGLLLSGKVNVLSGQQFLHPILPCEFLDSPEFESSRATVDEKFKVSIVAASSCRYLYWQRSSLEYLFVKETYLASVVTTLIARDITTKLYAMNNKIVTEKGSHLDIRLPSITGSLASTGEFRTPTKMLSAKHLLGCCPMSPDSGTYAGTSNKEKSYYDKAVVAPEMEPLTEQPSNDDLHSAGIDSWHDNSSRYHSCELVETDEEMKED